MYNTLHYKIITISPFAEGDSKARNWIVGETALQHKLGNQIMVGFNTWLRYLKATHDHGVTVARLLQDSLPRKKKLKRLEVYDFIWKNMKEIHGNFTFLHWSKAAEQMPLLGTKGGVLLVRKLADMNTSLRVGDVIVHKDPKNLDNLLVRRVAGVEGWEACQDEGIWPYMPFVLVKNQVWALADNKILDSKRAHDSRTFGPLYVPYVLGRAIYCLRGAEDHGPIKNSPLSIMEDEVVMEVELDIDEMIKNHKDLE